ncbi:LRR receptor-like serine threonine-protein kinase [Seminavis robusta]|uniref:LRR receptor-like serine threonine-protein kinase n=1 Tax=Seminavis robusta TaxID=568900 RepID=A0A9N8HA00_9STRA|nr:LRR receptor-like serine threonine-protein kinase [Seminavis robusta]|eukprot:Sro224_g091630.1 LRR receptor-like serine threonine-protein kinase (1614) ;mRNA; f:37543-43250
MSALVVDCDLDCSCCDSCGEVAAAAVDTSGGPGEIVIGGGPSNGPDFGHSTGFSTDRNNTGAAQSVPAAGASSPFVEYLVNLPVTAPGVFDDPISPQSRAAYWVSYEDLYSASLPITDPKLLQRYALAAFYFATGGDNWGQCGRESTSCATTSWLSDSDECTWYSLGCTQQHQIFEIRFPPDGNHLVGILPAELSLLTGLKRLLASSNSINGGLDAPLAGLSLLEILYLPSNQFSGSIPDSLYTLTNLSFLSLAENSFTGTISPDIGQLTRLAKLNLGKASLSGTIPDMIGSLDASLTDLLLNDNLLAGPVPAALGQLTNLAKLEIQGNQMTGSIPAALCAQQLGVLIVDCEVQCSCCDSCGSAAVAAVLASSVLSGGDTSSLQSYLQVHPVTAPGVFEHAHSPQSLAASWIAQDSLSVGLQLSDPKLLQRYALATFYFATGGDNWEQCGRNSAACSSNNPWLTDGDDCSWYSLACNPQGEVFEIRFPHKGNHLNGILPAELSLLTGLKWLLASSNELRGGLDAPLAGLSLLEILYLPSNQFTGSIPDAFYSLTSLNTLSLADNAFTGTISPEIRLLANLRKLDLGKTSLSGTIPNSIGSLDSTLTDLLLNDNQLTGPVPAAFGQLTNLEKLQVQGNQLTGSIPSALCAQQLGMLIVGCEVQCTCCENCGNAAVAAFLASSVLSAGDTSMLVSYLSALPVTTPGVFDDPFSPQSLAASWIAQDVFSAGLQVSDSKLLQRYALATFYFATGGENWHQCGRESPSCGATHWLTDGDACAWYSLGCTQQGDIFEIRFPPHGNRLIGSLPAELSLLTGLKRLLASSNGIGGTLDAPLAGLSLLEILYLPSNQLSGSIPDSLYSLTSLNSLTLAENALTGTMSPDIGQLVSLKDLFLPSLEKLRIEGNQLSGSIPAAVCAQQLVTLVVDCEVQCTCCDNCGDAAVAAIDGSTGGLESFVAYLKTLPFTLSSAFDDSSSPQSRAASWAIEEDGLSASLPVRDPKLLQRYALAAFYFATGGDSWSQCGRNSAGCATSNPWLTAADECTWFSLGCSNDGVLVEIRFPPDGNRLIGPVPPDVSLLSGLKRFSAPTNAMSGSLDAFSGLSNLQTLYVSLNRFRGSIPASVYSLTSLDTLSLEQNALTGSISTLIGRLTDVSVLELGSSSLAGPIPDVSRLMHLSELNLEKTSLSGTIPESIGSLHASLTDVFLNDNRLTGPVPAAFGQLTKLETLQIQGNQLTGTIPVAFCSQNMSALVVDCDLDCSCCDSCGQPEQATAGIVVVVAGPSNGVGQAASAGASPLVQYLETLPVTAPGVFNDPNSPQSLAASWITDEDLYSAGLPTTDPKLLQRYALATFYFATNGDNWEFCGRESLSCTATTWLTDEDECTWFSLGCTNQGVVWEVRFPANGNRINGPIPAELSLLTGLKRFLASSNAMGGSLDALAGLSLLEILYLPSNQFRGSLPDSLYSLTSLKTVSLAQNGLTGSISPQIGQLTDLGVLELGSSTLAGPIPTEMFQLVHLKELNVERAFLTGTIPESIRLLNASLTDLLLNNNGLTGPLPQGLDHLTALEKLEIQGNQLTGTISAAVCAQRGSLAQELSTLMVDCEVECSCCDNANCAS